MNAWATNLQFDAERKAGAMLRDMPKAKGGLPYQSTDTPSVLVDEKPQTLAEQGISLNQSSKWQAMAAIPEDTVIQIESGEMLAKMKKDGKRQKQGGNKKSKSQSAILIAPTLADIGVDATQSSRWQKLAAVPEEQFELDVIVASELASETINPNKKG